MSITISTAPIECAGEILDRTEQGGDRRRIELGLANDEGAVGGAAIVGRFEEAFAIQRSPEQFEFVFCGELECDVDAAGALELVEEGLGEGQAELDRAEMLAVECHRHHAANAEAGDAALEADDRLAVGIGGDHGLAKPGQVVAELGRLVDPQIGQRRRRVELKLVDAVVGFQYREARPEQFDQGSAVVARHRFLNRGHGRNHGAHGGGPARLLSQPRQQRIVVAAQFALIGAIDNAGNDPHRAKQDENGGSGRGQRQRRGDPRPQAETQSSGRLDFGCGGHPVWITKRS